MNNIFKWALVATLVFGFGHQAMAKSSEKKECKKCLGSKFKSLDKDDSGSLSIDEFKTCDNGKCEKGNEKLFMKADTNKDGSLSLEEFKAAMKKCSGKEKNPA